MIALFRGLAKNYGFLYWWPAGSPIEVIEGAILAQNTSWKNVEKAMRMIKGESIDNILNRSDLKHLIRSAGFFERKGRYLRGVLDYYRSWLESLSLPMDLRTELLELDGVGRETADSIALYGFHQRTVPVDSYTLRLFNRYFGTAYSNRDYETIRLLLCKLFNQEQLMEFHALVDEHCKMVCKKVPICGSCPINSRCKSNH